MEKRTPHRKLTVVKDLVKAGKVRATATAINGASELGINSVDEMCGVAITGFGKTFTGSKIQEVLIFI